MKTILFVFALIFSAALSSSAETVPSILRTNTVGTVVASTNSGSAMGKSKKAHHKKHKHTGSVKKAK